MALILKLYKTEFSLVVSLSASILLTILIDTCNNHLLKYLKIYRNSFLFCVFGMGEFENNEETPLVISISLGE